MRAVLSVALAVAVVSMALGVVATESAQAQTTKDFCDREAERQTNGNSDAASTRDRLGQGEEPARRCAVYALESLQYDEGSDYGSVRAAGRTLADYYAARSERQQSFLDTGAFFTGAGTLGYAFSGPAGAVTQSYWGYGALLPIILVEFNANEPTRDLFFAGRIGTDLIRDRYALLDRRLTWIGTLADADEESASSDCEGVEEKLAEIARWRDGDDKTALQPTALAIADRCRELRSGRSSIATLVSIGETWKDEWPRAFAHDLLVLESRLSERDRLLRTTPREALTMLVSTPLRTLDTLISGENAQAALNSIAVQDALVGLGFPLTDISLPEAPIPIDIALTAPPAVVARTSSRPVPAVRTGGVTLIEYNPGVYARWLQDRVALLESARQVHNRRAIWSREFYDASRANQLEFSYNVTNRRVEVVLRAPGAQAPATGTTPTS